MLLPLLADGVGTFPDIAGADGQDGNGIEYVFAVTLDPFITIGQLPLDNWGFDQPGTVGGLTWEDGAPNVDENRPYLWRSQRRVPGIPAIGAAVLDPWSTPVVVGRWGPDGSSGLDGIAGLDGTDGEDGRGLEYIFAVTGGPTLPQAQHPDNTWGYDEPDIVDTLQWHDGGPAISSVRPYLWRAIRRIIGAPDVGDAVVDDWREPVIVGRWAVDGQPGLAGIDGANGTDGNDGIAPEYIFALTDTSTVPAAQRPLDSWGYDQPQTVGGLQWHDDAPSLTEAFQYQWRSQRSVPGNPAPGTPITDTWTLPTLVGKWGESGVPGADGDDGNGVEYVFARTNADTLSPAKYPDNTWGFDEPQTIDQLQWFDGAPPLTQAINFLWRSERRVVGVPAVGTAVPAVWSVPVIVGVYGLDGVPGADGQDGTDGVGTEFVFAVDGRPRRCRRVNDPITPGALMCRAWPVA